MQKIKEYLLTTIGVALTAIALEYFFFPCDIAAGGLSGIGLVVNKVSGLDTSIVVLVLTAFETIFNAFDSFCWLQVNFIFFLQNF